MLCENLIVCEQLIILFEQVNIFNKNCIAMCQQVTIMYK